MYMYILLLINYLNIFFNQMKISQNSVKDGFVWPFSRDTRPHVLCKTLRVAPQRTLMHGSMAISVEHRSTFAALHRSWWRLYLMKNSRVGRNRQNKQTNKQTNKHTNKRISELHVATKEGEGGGWEFRTDLATPSKPLLRVVHVRPTWKPLTSSKENLGHFLGIQILPCYF